MAALVGLLAKTSLASSWVPATKTWRFDENPRPVMVVRVPPVHGPCEGWSPVTAKAGPRSRSSRMAASSPRFVGGGVPASSTTGLSGGPEPGRHAAAATVAAAAKAARTRRRLPIVPMV